MFPVFIRLMRTWLWAGLISAGTLAGAVDTSTWFTRSWQTDDGLPNNEVTAITQGPDGYLWVGTVVGLARFDGFRFKEFSYSNSSTNEDQGVNALLPGRTGGLWIKMRRWPVVRLSPDLAQVTPAATNLPDSRPSSMIEDRDGCLWIAYPDSVWQVRNGQATRLNGEPGLNPPGVANGFAMDADGTIWAAKGNYVGLFRQSQFVALGSTKYRPHLAAARGHGVWIAAGRQLLKCDPTNGLQDCGFFQPENHAEPTVVMEDHTGAVWIGTGSAGLFRRDEAGSEKIETSHPGILSLAEDREGNIWAGTAGGGLDRISVCGVGLEGLGSGSSLAAIQSICQDTQGRLWGATQNGLLVTRATDGWSQMFTNGELAEASTCVAADRAGGVWIGMRNRLLSHLRDGRLTIWDTNAGLNGHVILALLPAANGDLWIDEQAPTGLQCLHDGQLRTVKLPGYVGRLTALAEDATGTIWAGSERGALLRVAGDQLVNETAVPAPDRSILSLSTTADGALWIGYEGSGLGRLKDGRFSRIASGNGLYDDYISQIIADDEGWFWFGCQRGIFKVRRAELESVMSGGVDRVRSINYGQNEGLFSVEANSANVSPFVSPVALRSRDGHLWIPLRKSLMVIQPKILHASPAPPPVLLSQVAMDGEVIASGGGVAETPAAVNLNTLRTAMKLPPNHRRLEFDFTAINLSAPENIRFRYRLDGLDDNWVNAESRSAVYSRLTAGTYQFKVEASNGDGPWSEAPATLAFTVQPFVWQTWWFQLGVLLGFTALLIFFVRYLSFRRLQMKLQLLEQQAALDKERTRIARDLHDDLGCSLTHVALMLEMNEQSSPGAGHTNGKAQVFSPMVRQVVKSVDEIIWAISPRNDQLQYLFDYIVEFAVEFLHAANIRPQVDLPEQVAARTVSPEVRHNLFLVVKEALNNVARHAHASEVTFRITDSAEALTILIEDNGRGFETVPDKATADGLRNMRQRMEEIGGQFQLTSKPGAGTRISLLYPWPHSR